mmetsp:Transcript_25571/g.72839  ORF Transcript_25571/g.72839 Transcript_25571/m.72839 type:complete len:198 (-) Transcript_25571:116-709(-)
MPAPALRRAALIGACLLGGGWRLVAGAYCRVGKQVVCLGSGHECSGNQCCPRSKDVASNKTFPCPSAARAFVDCESPAKQEDCVDPEDNTPWIPPSTTSPEETTDSGRSLNPGGSGLRGSSSSSTSDSVVSSSSSTSSSSMAAPTTTSTSTVFSTEPLHLEQDHGRFYDFTPPQSAALRRAAAASGALAALAVAFSR